MDVMVHRARVWSAILLLCLAIVASDRLPAHGGQYRGPGWNTPPMPGSPSAPGPATGGPPGATGPAGPTTGGRPLITDGTSWQVWWEFSKDPLLQPDQPLPPEIVSGSDEFFLGSPGRDRRDRQSPSQTDRRDRIAAALAKALQGERNRDVVTACLVALGKVGLDPPGQQLGQLFAPHLMENDQEVRETATLAHGIAGAPSRAAVATNVQRLGALLRDDAEGRKLAGGPVSERQRTFAAWGLGLLAHATDDVASKQQVYGLLATVLQDRDEKSRDLRVGVIESLGLLDLHPARSAGEQRLLWTAVAELSRYLALDLGRGDQLVQAHAPIALARLLGRGDSPDHQRVKALLSAELTTRSRRHNNILQSAALALGTMCLPPERCAEDGAAVTALVHGYKQLPDRLSQFFCALALGRIGGDTCRKHLLAMYDDANKTIERPWVALALGLIARERRLQPDGVVDVEIGRLLLRDVQAVDYDDAQAAYALAVGLSGHQEAGPVLLKLLFEKTRTDMLAGYLAVGLGLLDHRPAADQLLDLMRASKRRPLIVQQCAVALRRLGDGRAVPVLLDMLAESESTAVAAAVAQALAQIRDKRSIDPLIALLQDQGRTKLTRAFAAAALGGVGDRSPMPWNVMIATDINYMATVDTLTNGSSGVLDIL